MNTLLVIIIVIAILHGSWSVHRQMQRWSGNSPWRLISTFLLNSIGWWICLPWSIVNGTFLPKKGEVQKPISTYKPKSANIEK
jgi:hypothetical protein